MKERERAHPSVVMRTLRGYPRAKQRPNFTNYMQSYLDCYSVRVALSKAARNDSIHPGNIVEQISSFDWVAG